MGENSSSSGWLRHWLADVTDAVRRGAGGTVPNRDQLPLPDRGIRTEQSPPDDPHHCHDDGSGTGDQ